MFSFLRSFVTGEDLFAALVTAGIAVLLFCSLECLHCPRREEDDLFRHRNP